MSRISRRISIGELTFCMNFLLGRLLTEVYRLIEKDYMEREEGNMYSYIA